MNASGDKPVILLVEGVGEKGGKGAWTLREQFMSLLSRAAGG